MKQVVAALIVRKDQNEEQILICQRTEDQPLALKWEFPGGKIEPGEEASAALHRELHEELGIRAAIGVRVKSLQYTYANGNAVELQFFKVTEFTGEIQNLIFKDVRWVRRKDLPGYDFLEADVALVREIAEGGLV